MILYPPQKLDSEESKILSSSFCISRGNQTNEVIYNMVLTHILKRWEEIKTQSNLRLSAMTASEKNILRFVALF